MVKCVVLGCPNRSDNNKGAFPNRPSKSKRSLHFPKDQTRIEVCLEHIICLEKAMMPFLPLQSRSCELVEDTKTRYASRSTRTDAEPRSDVIKRSFTTFTTSATEPNPVVPDTPFVLQDLSLALLTKMFLRLLRGIPHGFMDLNLAAKNLNTSKLRVYDLTNCLEGINLIQKQSANKIKWLGPCPVTSFLQNLKTVEESLDELIKTCAQQLFDMTDDISGIKVFQEQTVVAINALEKTKLEVPTPKKVQ
uniref:E2F transcription factor 6 n=1 Tax=Salmo trutta TaxID=8032 RepID=A0A674D2P7_SALTR